MLCSSSEQGVRMYEHRGERCTGSRLRGVSRGARLLVGAMIHCMSVVAVRRARNCCPKFGRYMPISQGGRGSGQPSTSLASLTGGVQAESHGLTSGVRVD